MYYSGNTGLSRLEQATIDIVAQDPDPRRPFPEQQPEDFQVAMPLFGSWYWGSPYLGPESYYNPLTYPYAVVNPYIPRWSGSFIQPGNIDPLVKVSNKDWAPLDPTGGSFWEESEAGELGPGESIAVGSQWAGDIHPRGFSSAAMHGLSNLGVKQTYFGPNSFNICESLNKSIEYHTQVIRDLRDYVNNNEIKPRVLRRLQKSYKDHQKYILKLKRDKIYWEC